MYWQENMVGQEHLGQMTSLCEVAILDPGFKGTEKCNINGTPVGGANMKGKQWTSLTCWHSHPPYNNDGESGDTT